MCQLINDVVIRRHDDLKQMLDSNKDHLKLEAMKRIIGMVAKVRRQSIQFNSINWSSETSVINQMCL